MESHEMRPDFCAKKFVDNLLAEGAKVPCDESSDSFKSNNSNLPSFYNEIKFKSGQEFYRDNIFGLFLSKLLGLVAILSIPSILRVLQFTKMSGDNITAFKRYMATIWHMKVWYEEDFHPNSKLWNSIENVRNRHNSASKRCCSAGPNMGRISQMDMVLTQFGFMGFSISRPKLMGIHFDEVKEESRWSDFVHLWRVIGSLMGIEDRFNMCRESVMETRAICEELIRRIFISTVHDQRQDFVEMAGNLIDGMWVMQPMLERKAFMAFLVKALSDGDVEDNLLYKQICVEMSVYQRFIEWLVSWTMSTMCYRIVRAYHNATMRLTFFLMRCFPFLAFYKYGIKYSFVKILNGLQPVKIETSEKQQIAVAS